MDELETRIRELKIPQLKVLKMLASEGNGISSSKEIADTTSTSSYTLGAMLTPLLRIKNENGSLIIKAGREIDGSVRWQLNNKVISREKLLGLITSMDID
jgi:hypothetical protein